MAFAWNWNTQSGPNWEIYGHWQDEWNRDPTKIVTNVFYLLVADGKSATATVNAAGKR